MYVSGDVDLLIPRDQLGRTRELLGRTEWIFDKGNGLLWRYSAAASYSRAGFSLDLHWGLHAAHLAARSLRPLEQALWEHAIEGPSGMLEPDAESLFVYLAVHAAGHGFERSSWVKNVEAAARLVTDWQRVWEIARSSRVVGAVRLAMRSPEPGLRRPLLDGVTGRVIWYGTWLGRGHFLPEGARERIRERRALRRLGFDDSQVDRWQVKEFAGLTIRVAPGVFRPRTVTEEVLNLGLRLVEGSKHPVAVDVGTGSGAIAVAFARAMPNAEMHATDVSARALRCARSNTRTIGIEGIRFHRGNLLEPLPQALRGRVDVILTNLPYVVAEFARKVDWDAPISTVAGTDLDGLGLMRVIADEAMGFLRPGGWLVSQIQDWQWESWAAELEARGYDELIPPPVRRPGFAIVGGARFGGSRL